MIKVNKTQKRILFALVIAIILVLSLLLSKFAFSYLGLDIADDLVSEGEVTANGDTLIFSKGNTLSLQATADNFNSYSGNLSDTTNPKVKLIANSKSNNATASYYVGFRINENTYQYTRDDQKPEVILTVRDENGYDVTSLSGLNWVSENGVSGFDLTGQTGTFEIDANHSISTNSSSNGTTHVWEFTLTFINYENDQALNESASLKLDIIMQKENLYRYNMTFAEYIKTVVYYEDGVGGLYHHTKNLENSANDDSYRYSNIYNSYTGNYEEPNNYVCFGSSSETCSTNNIYRIIGVYDDKVKLLYNAYVYDNSYDNNGSNNWSSSSLLANLESYLSMGSLVGNVYPDWDDQSYWSAKIATVDWRTNGIPGNSISDFSATNVYKYELGTESNKDETYRGKIGLPYLSEYMYMQNIDGWGYSGYYYIWAGFNLFWTISKNSDTTDNVFRFNYNNYGYESAYATYYTYYQPTFYLNSDVKFISGTGTYEDPYRID